MKTKVNIAMNIASRQVFLYHNVINAINWSTQLGRWKADLRQTGRILYTIKNYIVEFTARVCSDTQKHKLYKNWMSFIMEPSVATNNGA